ncbi:sensor histidine kinase, partial [Actinotalea sp. C106]|uniref:sensor histidine kinase n=1 Tax=Actinotalea sp. C106 TaxID=2908644 RepID=UPI002027ACB6
ERQIQALRREHEARVETAVARERAAMARELHDVAAHHLSGIAVMTGAIGRQIDVDPEAAKAAVQRVRGETTAMLDELRSLVRLLRDAPAVGQGAEVEEARVETLATIPALVERVRASGVQVSLEVLGTADGPPPGEVVGPLAQLSVYRTVQECLANAARHAPGAACAVVLDARDPAALVVSVRNDPPTFTSAPPARHGFEP